MSYAPEVMNAAVRILDGDDSTMAAAALESAIHAHHPFDDELHDLLEALALRAPSTGAPYVDHPQLCDAIRRSGVLGGEY